MVTPIVTEIPRDPSRRNRSESARPEDARKTVHDRQVVAVRQALLRGVDAKRDRT